MAQFTTLADLWSVQVTKVTQGFPGEEVVVEVVKALTPACAAEKWASFHKAQLRHVSQRDLPSGSTSLFEAVVLTIDGVPTQDRLRVFDALVLI